MLVKGAGGIGKTILLLWFLSWMSQASAYSFQNDFTPSSAERESGAVVIERTTDLKLIDNDRSEETIRVVVAILDEQAASDYRQISIHFNSFYDAVELISARSIDADGRIYQVADDAMQVKSVSQGPVYDELKALTFSLPSVKPGSFIEYAYRITDTKALIDNHWFSSEVALHYQQGSGSGRIDPIRRFEVTAELPPDSPVRFVTRNTDVKVKMEKLANGQRLRWRLDNLPARPLEDKMVSLSEFIPELLLTSIPSWEDVDEWAHELYHKAAEPTLEVQRAARKLFDAARSKRETVKDVFYFVQKNIRYIEADVTRGGLVPHSAESVLNHQYGDCKDQATLVVAMLKSLGIDASPALISPFPGSTPHPDMPMLRFSHMIVYVPDDEGGIWLDTSSDAGGFPGIDWTLHNRVAFVIDGAGGQLETLQATSASQGTLSMRIDFEVVGSEALGKLEIEMNGALSHRFKVLGKNHPEVAESVERSLNALYVNGKVENYTVNGNFHTEAPYSISAVVRLPLENTANDLESIPVTGDASQVYMFTDLAKLPSKKRTYPFRLSFPYEMSFRVNLKLPDESFHALPVTGNSSFANDYFSLEKKINVSDEMIGGETRFNILNSLVMPEDYEIFRTDLRKAVSDSKWLVVAKRDKRTKTKNEFTRQLEDDGNNAVAMINLARHHISLAEYDQALELAQQAAELEPNNGEAHYALGIALGFLNRFEESTREIQIARELGYRP
jgi:transglutaminase-like putative cysteine protease